MNTLVTSRSSANRVIPGFGLSLGFTIFYLALIVLIPLSAVFLKTFTIDEFFGGWTKAQKEHFDDGAIYDKILAAPKT